MKLLQKIVYFLFWPFLLMGCSPGYKKIDNRWAYVTWDEGNGKNVNYIDVDGQTFEVLNDPVYAKDKQNVFFEGRPIKNADSKTFRIIGRGYSTDDYQVYLRNYTVIGADPKSFKPLKSLYSRDQTHIFCGTVPMNVDDTKHFKVINSTYSYGMQPLKEFIKNNPGYEYLDTSKYENVIYGYGKAQTLTEQFEGYKKLK